MKHMATTAARKAAITVKAIVAFTLVLVVSASLFGCGGLTSCSKQPDPAPAPETAAVTPADYSADDLVSNGQGAYGRISEDGNSIMVYDNATYGATVAKLTLGEWRVVADVAVDPVKIVTTTSTSSTSAVATNVQQAVFRPGMSTMATVVETSPDTWTESTACFNSINGYRSSGAVAALQWSPSAQAVADDRVAQLIVRYNAGGWSAVDHTGAYETSFKYGFDDTYVITECIGVGHEDGSDQASGWYASVKGHRGIIMLSSGVAGAVATGIADDGILIAVFIGAGYTWAPESYPALGELSAAPPAVDPKAPAKPDPTDEERAQAEEAALEAQKKADEGQDTIDDARIEGIIHDPSTPDDAAAALIDGSDLVTVTPNPDGSVDVTFPVIVDPGVTSPIIIGDGQDAETGEGNGTVVAIRPVDPDRDDADSGWVFVPGLPGIDTGILIPSLPSTIGGGGEAEDLPIVGVDQESRDRLIEAINAKTEAGNAALAAGDINAANALWDEAAAMAKAFEDLTAHIVDQVAEDLAAVKAAGQTAKDAQDAAAKAAEEAAKQANQGGNSGETVTPPPPPSDGETVTPPPGGNTNPPAGGGDGDTSTPPPPPSPPGVVGMELGAGQAAITDAGFTYYTIQDGSSPAAGSWRRIVSQEVSGRQILIRWVWSD